MKNEDVPQNDLASCVPARRRVLFRILRYIISCVCMCVYIYIYTYARACVRVPRLPRKRRKLLVK